MLKSLQPRIQFVDTQASYLESVSASLQNADFRCHVECTRLVKFEELESAVRSDVDVTVIGIDHLFSKNLPLVKVLIESRSGRTVAIAGASNTLDDAKSALAAGARGYIQRSHDHSCLLSALQVLLSGGIYIPDHLHSEQNKTNVAMRTGSVDPFFDAKQKLRVAGATKRELVVAAMLAQGASNKVIARELGLTEGTVKTYVHRLLKLLGASNRTEAALSMARLRSPLEELNAPSAATIPPGADFKMRQRLHS
jgi:DNA-binding NarL/FixJ family response regulator